MNEPEVPKQPAAPPDPVASSPTPPPDTEPFVATLHRMWARLKAHKVVQWTLAYLAIAYTLLHGAEMLAGYAELVARAVTDIHAHPDSGRSGHHHAGLVPRRARAAARERHGVHDHRHPAGVGRRIPVA